MTIFLIECCKAGNIQNFIFDFPVAENILCNVQFILNILKITYLFQNLKIIISEKLPN